MTAPTPERVDHLILVADQQCWPQSEYMDVEMRVEDWKAIVAALRAYREVLVLVSSRDKLTIVEWMAAIEHITNATAVAGEG